MAAATAPLAAAAAAAAAAAGVTPDEEEAPLPPSAPSARYGESWRLVGDRCSCLPLLHEPPLLLSASGAAFEEDWV